MNEPFGNSPGNRIMPAMREALRPSGLDPGGRKRVEKRFGFSRKSRPFSGKIPGFNVIFRKISGYYSFGKRVEILQTGCAAARRMQTLPKSMQMPFNEKLARKPALSRAKSVKVCQSHSADFQSASRRLAASALGLARRRKSGPRPVQFRFIRLDSESKNQGGSRLLKLAQGGSRLFETFFYDKNPLKSQPRGRRTQSNRGKPARAVKLQRKPLKHFTMNDLRHNRGLGRSKSVKVSQSDMAIRWSRRGGRISMTAGLRACRNFQARDGSVSAVWTESAVVKTTAGCYCCGLNDWLP